METAAPLVKQNIYKAWYHLPGLFEFYEFYRVFLPLFKEHREYFYDWCEIGSIYGVPADCLWGGGRVEIGTTDPGEVLQLLREHGISARLTFSNSLLAKEHLSDAGCNALCRLFQETGPVRNGIILHSDLLLDYLKEKYPDYYFVSSTTKVLTDFRDFLEEARREEFAYVVPDFRLNKAFANLFIMPKPLKDKVEFLCNECCPPSCLDRGECYEEVSRKNLGIESVESSFACRNSLESGRGYRFSKAMESPAFISVDDIQNIYLPGGFSNFKIEGRGLGSAMLLEFLLYYMVKPKYQIHVREAVYLDNMLDLF